MNRRAPIPPFAADSLPVSALLARGLTRGRVQASDMPRASHGVVVNPALLPLDTVELRCRALLPALRESDRFSRYTAAALYGLPVSGVGGWRAPLMATLDVATELPARAMRRAGVTGHAVRTGVIAVRSVAGLPVASPADTWCLLAPLVPFRVLVALGDAMLSGARIERGGGRRSPPLATLDELCEADKRHGRSPGSRARATALPLLRWPVDSPAETVLRLCIASAGFPEPTVNCAVEVEGRVLYADLGYPDHRVAIEHEGRYHFIGGEEQARFDVERQELMMAAGWRVLRATARDLRAPQGFLVRLAGALGFPAGGA